MSIRDRDLPRSERTPDVGDLIFHHAAGCGMKLSRLPVGWCSRDCVAAACRALGFRGDLSAPQWREVAAYFARPIRGAVSPPPARRTSAASSPARANGVTFRAADNEEIHSEPPGVEADGEGDYELVECERCDGTGKIGDELCTDCMGKGELERNVGEPDQPPARKKFDDEPVKPSGTPARKQGTKPEGRVSDLERRVARTEARYGITSHARREPQKANVMDRNTDRLVDHDGILVAEKGSPEFMELARAYAAKHQVPLEVAMLDVARARPGLVR